MSRESPHFHAGILLNPVLLYVQLGEFSSISSLFLILFTGPLLPLKSPESRWMSMKANPQWVPRSPKLLLTCLRVQMAGCKISQAAQRPSSRVQAPMNKSCSSTQYSGPGYWVAFVIHLSSEHLIIKLQKFLMIIFLMKSLYMQYLGLLECVSICAKNSKLALGKITLTVTEPPTCPSMKGCIWFNNN